jgi:tetratricopeptide (TPR) repeat protein
MDIRTCFEQGKYLEIADAPAQSRTPEEDLMVGISLFKVGRETDAMAVFREISDRVRDLARAFFFMALVHRGRGDFDAARSCIETYLSFYPDDDEALDLLQDEQEEAPLMNEASPELAKIYAGQGHYSQALEIYAQLLKKSGDDPKVRKEADRVQRMYLIKTLEGWLERTRK